DPLCRTLLRWHLRYRGRRGTAFGRYRDVAKPYVNIFGDGHRSASYARSIEYHGDTVVKNAAGAVDASATFLSQYATSPILTGLIQAANAAIDPQADFDAFMANVWNVYTAQGFGLDCWGRIVNIPRTINIPASSTY